MFPEFNEDMVANMVAMMRADVDGAIWLVDNDEEGRFYETAANEQGRVVPAFGSATFVLRRVSERGIEGVFAVVRSPAQEERPAVFRPDVGDVASLLLLARSADRVLGEVGGAAWLTAAGRDIGGILPRAVLIARRLERLLDFPVTDERIAECVDWSVADISWGAGAVGGRTPDALREAREMAVGEPAEGLHCCDGMSVVRVLAAASCYYRPRGIQAYRGVSTEQLMSLLRSSFDLEEIEKDGLYWRLKAWEWGQGRYSVFRSWRTLDQFKLLIDHRYFEADVECLCRAGPPFAVLQLDLDRFKTVNNRLNHIEGDNAIRLAERVLLGSLRGRGDAYRRGGDELTAVLVGIPRNDAEQWAHELRAKLESEFAFWSAERGLTPAPTASVGLVHVSTPLPAADLLSELEAVQLQAKNAGGNRVEVNWLPTAQ